MFLKSILYIHHLNNFHSIAIYQFNSYELLHIMIIFCCSSTICLLYFLFKVDETHETEKKAQLTASLSGLVTAGTITQDQADKILAYVNTLEANKPDLGTTAPSADQKDKKTNPLSALVDNGTLTQAQLDEVCKVLPMGGGHGHGGHAGSRMNKPAKATTDTSK